MMQKWLVGTFGWSFILLATSFLNPLEAAESFDHEPWHRVLAMVVSSEGFVNYDWLRSDHEDLDRYLDAVKKVSPTSHPERFPTREDELVYWLQVYNALAMRHVLNFPGLKKTSDKKLRFFVFSKFKIGGIKYSLRSLENKMIREVYKDARVHFFLNCASYSCPKLYQEPLLPETLNDQLDQYARNFFNDSQHLQFDAKEGVLSLSMILKWYQKDFLSAMKETSGGKKEKIVAYLNQYREEKIPIAAVKKIKYIPYNWTVNDIKNL